MGAGGWVCFGLLILGLFILLSWFVVANDYTFDGPCRLQPGGTYEVAGRTYRVPNLPHKVLGTEQKALLNRPLPKLPDSYLEQLRQLAQSAFQLFRTAQVPFWVTGGTLFSAHVWQHFMPFDDDIDVSVFWEDRAYVWSAEFAQLASLAGLEVILLRGASLNLATREGGAVRLRLKQTYTPMLDIFFTQRQSDGRYAKIDSWWGDQANPNKKEVWAPEWLLPLRDEEIDGFLWSLPQSPEALLKQQYGPNCLETIQSPNPLTKTHVWVTYFTNLVGAWRQVRPSPETDVSKLTNPRFRATAVVSVSP